MVSLGHNELMYSPSQRDSGTGGHMIGRNVSRSKRPVLDCAFKDQYRFSNSMMSVSSTVKNKHYSDVIMRVMASHITSLTTVYSTVYSGTVQRKHQSSASLAFERGIHRWPVNSPHKGPVMQKMFPFDDVIMKQCHVIIRQWYWHLTFRNFLVKNLQGWREIEFYQT